MEDLIGFFQGQAQDSPQHTRSFQNARMSRMLSEPLIGAASPAVSLDVVNHERETRLRGQKEESLNFNTQDN